MQINPLLFPSRAYLLHKQAVVQAIAMLKGEVVSHLNAKHMGSMASSLSLATRAPWQKPMFAAAFVGIPSTVYHRSSTSSSLEIHPCWWTALPLPLH
jgi:hypothetical protein